MSKFRVKLSNDRQGQLDIYNNQRSAYIMGPNKVNRKLKDGEIFTDSNYWKRFAYPQVSLEEAFIEVIEDDGTIWSDNLSENAYPKVYDLNTEPNSEFSQNKAEIAKDSGSWAIFAQITNKGNNSVKVRLNGLDSAIMDLDGGNTQVFNAGELAIGLIEIANYSEDSVSIQIVVSIRTISLS